MIVVLPIVGWLGLLGECCSSVLTLQPDVKLAKPSLFYRKQYRPWDTATGRRQYIHEREGDWAMDYLCLRYDTGNKSYCY